jgi:hypothetical protein
MGNIPYLLNHLTFGYFGGSIDVDELFTESLPLFRPPTVEADRLNVFQPAVALLVKRGKSLAKKLIFAD